MSDYEFSPSSMDDINAELEYNRQHPLFADVDDYELGKRKEGCFVEVEGEDEDGYSIMRIIFDNGHTYYVNGNTVNRGNDIPTSLLIHKYLEKVVYDYVRQVPFPIRKDVCCNQYVVSVDRNIRLVIDKANSMVCITHIFIPQDALYMYHNYGKDFIAKIYQQCKQLGYRLWLVNMVPSFYDRMVKRGAKVIDHDVVEIDDSTDLSKH